MNKKKRLMGPQRERESTYQGLQHWSTEKLQPILQNNWGFE